MSDEPSQNEGSGPEITAQQAADALGVTLAHVVELARNGVLTSRAEGDAVFVRVSDVEVFGERRRRQLTAARRISNIVNRSPDGWDS